MKQEDVLGSIRLFLALTVLLGGAYPLAVWGIGRVAFREKADGGFLRMGEGPGGAGAREPQAAPRGRIVGSALIGQSFHSKKFFFSRPSAAGDSGYDPTASGGTNLGPTSKKLADSIRERVAALRAEYPFLATTRASLSVPADAVTASASGLDPHISPEYARLQISRVSRETGISTADLEVLVASRTEGRFLGLFGEPRVNVLLLNLDLLARPGPSAAP